MTDTQQILSLIKEQGKLLRKLQRQVNQDEWLTAERVKEKFGLGKKTLQILRRDGTIKEFRCFNGRNFQYRLSEIEKLFTEIKN